MPREQFLGESPPIKPLNPHCAPRTIFGRVVLWRVRCSTMQPHHSGGRSRFSVHHLDGPMDCGACNAALCNHTILAIHSQCPENLDRLISIPAPGRVSAYQAPRTSLGECLKSSLCPENNFCESRLAARALQHYATTPFWWSIEILCTSPRWTHGLWRVHCSTMQPHHSGDPFSMSRESRSTHLDTCSKGICSM